MSFPENFVWGAATASYQIEGGASQDGRGDSVWDHFCRVDGRVKNGESGAVACDHYNRFREDVDLFSSLSLQSYRFSLSWSRLIPEGLGKINSKGVAFYDSLIDSLLEKGIDPCVTLFHWDYPLELYWKGGWLNRDSASWFTEYALKAQELFGDRVNLWITQNEPQCFIELGHKTGYHAPGNTYPMESVLRAAHHSLLAHGMAYGAMKREQADARVGYAPVGITFMPENGDCEENIRAAREYMFSHHGEHLFTNTWFMDPVFFGRYPEDGLKLYGEKFNCLREGDLDIIGAGADFLGVNIYHGEYVNKEGELLPFPQGHPRTAMGWQITDEALYWGPKFLYERYGKPLIITENGMAGTDVPDSSGLVDDSYRISYYKSYIAQLKRAVSEGIDVGAYYAWSALDNFEWAEGYEKRFGLIYVDYKSGERRLKSSAKWYKSWIESGGSLEI